MSKAPITITCDRANNLWRVCVWQGSALRDLYIDNINNPAMTDAVVEGRVVRTIPSQKAAFIDCGLSETIFVTGQPTLKPGDKVMVSITSHARQGKAFSGKISKADKTSPPPKPWQRALANIIPYSREHNASVLNVKITFANREDYEECRASLDEQLLPILNPLSKEPVHPDLDETIDALLEPIVPMSGESSLVIEQTEALVSIDVNGDSAKNPLAINLQAVPEIAKQIRLRNLSGIIVVDALKMPQRTDTNKFINALKNATTDDPAGVDVFGITKLGLMEMTRTRQGPSLAEIMKGAK